MRYIYTGGLKISQFSLGTVQLGMDYGINNTQGKPKREQSFEILNTALRLGVNCLDTSVGYGDSERLIGEWLRGIPENDRPLIVTKVDRLDFYSKAALRSSLRESLRISKTRLGLERIPLLMIHNFDQYAEDPEEVSKAFEELRTQGEIERWGISAYSRHEYRMLAESSADAVQIPQNIFDWGQITGGGWDALARSGKIIYVRSVFLQGLVFMKPDRLPPQMAFAAPTLERFHSLCREFSMEPAILAISFVLSLPGVSSLVLGCERKEQVENDAELICKARHLTEKQMEQLRKAFEQVDPRVTDPGTWINSGRGQLDDGDSCGFKHTMDDTV